jgi:hypothetical protein
MRPEVRRCAFQSNNYRHQLAAKSKFPGSCQLRQFFEKIIMGSFNMLFSSATPLTDNCFILFVVASQWGKAIKLIHL